MIKFRIAWLQIATGIAAVILSFIVTSILVLAAGANPLEVFYHVVISPFTSRVNILEILARMTPLIFTGLAVVVAFKTGFWNIGAEGQLYAGALAATWGGITFSNLPALTLIPLVITLGFAAGALWALIAALLKIRFKVDEVVTTLLLNYVMILVVGAILNGPWRDPVSMWPQSPRIATQACYPIIVSRSRVHLGLLVALAIVPIVHFLFRRTTFGFEMRTVGANISAARYAAMNVNRAILLAAAISGGIAGLAGVGEILGVHHQLIETISGGLGYTGIVAGTLGGLNPWGTLSATVFLSTIETGARISARVTGIPTHLADVIKGTLLITTLAALFINRYQIGRKLWKQHY